jgi:dTDP-4-dehydrorhamnose 3,5-epimerase
VDYDRGMDEPVLEVKPAAPRDRPTVGDDGRPLAAIEGVRHVRPYVHADHRGSLTELIDSERPFWDEPVVYAYRFSVRPGRIKGWGMHRLQADRYVPIAGHLRVVLFDGRVGSPSHGRYAQFYFAEDSPGMLYIPPGVWHANQNAGDADAVVVNFPTRPYDRAQPDKHRIDPHSGEIPFDWELRDG